MRKQTKRTLIFSVVVLSLMSFLFLQSQSDSLTLGSSLVESLPEQEVKALTDGDIIEFMINKFIQVFIFNS